LQVAQCEAEMKVQSLAEVGRLPKGPEEWTWVKDDEGMQKYYQP